MIQQFIFVLLAYLVGGLPVGLVVGKVAKGIDLREHGSGNIGASNAWRLLGWKWGLPVFLLDVLKGYGPVCAAHHLPHCAAALPVLVGLAAIMGHNFSPFLGFRGGKGVATSLGVAFGLSLYAGLLGFGAWMLIVGVTRYISVASVFAVAVGSYFIWWFNGHSLAYGLFSLTAVIFVVVKHRSNFERLRDGTESKVEFKKKSAG